MRSFKRRHPPFYGGGSGSWWKTDAPETVLLNGGSQVSLDNFQILIALLSWHHIIAAWDTIWLHLLFITGDFCCHVQLGLPISGMNAVACSVPLYLDMVERSKFSGFYRFFQHCNNNNHKYWLMLSGLRCTFTEDRYCAAAKCTLSVSYNLLDAIFLLIAVHFTLKSRQCTNILMLVQYCGVVGVVVNYIVTCGVPTFYKSVAVPQCDGWLSAALPNSYPWSDRV